MAVIAGSFQDIVEAAHKLRGFNVGRVLIFEASLLNALDEAKPFPDYPRHPSRSDLGFPRVSGSWRGRDGIGGGVAALGPRAERGGVPGALRHRGGVPDGALRHAVAGGADLSGLRRPPLLRAHHPPGPPMPPL